MNKAQMTSQAGVVILTGTARGGANAIEAALNAHAFACIGTERYKYRFLRHKTYDPELFLKDRFFRFRKADTNQKPDRSPALEKSYLLMKAKWDTAQVIGDMVADLAPLQGDMMQANPSMRFVCVLRNLKDVALSWDARAQNNRSAWPSEKGFAQACEKWAAHQDILNTLIEDPELRARIFLLDFDRLTEQAEAQGEALRGFLELGPDRNYAANLARHARHLSRQPSHRIPEEFHADYKAVDQKPARLLRKAAQDDLSKWSQQDEDE
jgi:hypothetical protein